MHSVHDIEVQRIAEQRRLDKLKDAAQRNQWGQFATPPELAREIAQYAANRWSQLGRGDVRFLDPAVGTGAFYSALLQTFARRRIHTAAGVELDPLFASATRDLWGSSGLRVVEGDFTAIEPTEPFNLLLTNPPYVRHHHLPGAAKQRMRGRIAAELSLNLNGLAGLYCYFMLLADRWLESGGLAIWLVPTEFMTVNYGQAVKDYLLRRVKLLHVHRFCPSDVQFADALVSSAVVVFQKKSPPKDHEVQFTFGGRLLAPQREQTIKSAELELERKWTSFAQPVRYGARDSKTRSLTLCDLFTVKRGIATGDNKFFMLPKKDALCLGIPKQFCKPILPSPRHLRQNVIEAAEDSYPLIDKQFCVIDCDLPEEVLRERFSRFWEYLEEGKRRGIHQGYLASRRVPWYSQEKRSPATFLCTYMGRSSSARQGNPFRFIWNKSQAIAANVYLLLYAKGELKRFLDENPELQGIVFESLASTAGQLCVEESRVYGGGLYKLEPKELGRVSAQALVAALDGLSPQPQQLLFA